MEAAPFDQYNAPPVETNNSGLKDETPSDTLFNSAATPPPLPVDDPNRDSFFDWISAFLKPNQPSSPVLPVGDPPEDCPPCSECK